MLEPRSVVGPYEVEAAIGAGGMGQVYRAIDRRLGRIVALKVLPPEVTTAPDRLERFEIECRALAELSHPNILTIFDFNRHGGVCYAALEFVEGVTLRSLLASGPLSPRKAAEYAGQIARALAAAHARGVLHRDVKPENVMVTPGGQIKLLDFGLARRFELAGETTSLDGLTDPGKVLGTLGYMAPEQLRGQDLDERTDLFAVGVVLYEMLAGVSPFARADRVDGLAAILRDDPPPLTDDVPADLRRIVQRCLEKSPSERYQSASDLAFSLAACADSAGSGAVSGVSDRAVSRRGRAVTWAAGVGVAAGVAMAFGLIWWLNRHAPAAAFERVTYRLGKINSGRFAPGGRSVVFDATFDGREPAVYEVPLGSRDARPRGLTTFIPLAVSASGELAGIEPDRTRERSYRLGRLVLVPGRGAPRPIAEGVASADWAPDGRSLAVARFDGGVWLLEWPVGRVVHRSRRPIFDVRISPDGMRLAWLERIDNLKTDLHVLDHGRAGRVLAAAGATPGGLAWTPDGSEIWFTRAKSMTLSDTEIRAVTLSGQIRALLDLPGGVRLLDVSSDGRLLVSRARDSVQAILEDDRGARAIGWQTSSSLRDLSADGRSVLFLEDGHGGFDLYLRQTDGAPAVRLASGLDWGQARLSPDASRVALLHGDRVRIIPVGAGAEASLPIGLQVRAWLPDGRRLLLWTRGEEKNSPAIVAIDQPGAVQRLAGMVCDDVPVLTRRGADVACIDAEGTLIVASTGSQGAVRRIGKVPPSTRLIVGDPEGREIYATTGVFWPSIVRIDLRVGTVSPVREIALPDDTGVWRINPVLLTPDLRVVAYSAFRTLDELYVYSGVR